MGMIIATPSTPISAARWCSGEMGVCSGEDQVFDLSWTLMCILTKICIHHRRSSAFWLRSTNRLPKYEVSPPGPDKAPA